MDTEMIVIVGCLLGALVAWTIFANSFGERETLSIAERVKKVSEGAVVGKEEELQKSFFQRVMIPVSETISGTLGQYTPGNLTADASRLIQAAGMSNYLSGAQLAGFSWLFAAIGLLVGITIFISSKGTMGALAPILGALLGFRMPMIYMARRAKQRQWAIQKAMPFSLDLLAISVEAGMGFDGAVQSVSERTRGPLAEELQRTLTEVRLGKPRHQALVDLGLRTGVDDLKSFTSAVAFISQMGGSITDVLRIQAESMRIKRRQRAEEIAMKAPVKMMIPLVFFILPTLFIVVLGPAAILINRDL